MKLIPVSPILKNFLTVRELKKISEYPTSLVAAFEVLFQENDIVIVWPLKQENLNYVNFWFYNIREDIVYNYDLSNEYLVFSDDHDDSLDVLDMLVSCEKSYTLGEFRDRLVFLEMRTIGRGDVDRLREFLNTMNGVQ